MLDFWQVSVWSIVSLVVLFFMSKLMGNKQISQLNVFDYIIGISIGSIAAELAGLQGVDKPLNNVLAIVIYGCFAYLNSVITSKSLRLRKTISGRSIIIMDNGEIYRENMKKARIDTSDFLTLCREQGYFDISQIQTAIIEYDGNLSILPKSPYRPLTPNDMNLSVEKASVITVVALEGVALEANLHLVGRTKQWLINSLEKQGLKLENVFIALCDEKGSVSAYKTINRKHEEDRFE